MPRRPGASLGVVQLEPTLDSLQPALDTVDPPRLAGEITMQVGDRKLEGRQSMLHVAHIRPHLIHPCTDDAELLEHEVIEVIGR